MSQWLGGSVERAFTSCSDQLADPVDPLPNNVFPEEWMLHPLAVQKIWEVFGRAQVDLFASEDNSH